MSMQEFDGNACPGCLETMDSNVTCLRPTWSGHYDNVVCLDCAETANGAKVQCNWCMHVMYLECTDTTDTCLKCHATGYLMDVVEVYTNA